MEQNQNEKLPPKTCEIERLVTVDADVEKVLAGVKRSQRRNGRYADIGEIMELRGRKFEVTNLYQQDIRDISEDDAKDEGFSSLDEYKQYIMSMHKHSKETPANNVWVPKMQVWVHEFEEVK